MVKAQQKQATEKPQKKRRGLKLFRHLVWGVLSLGLLVMAVLVVTLQLFVFWLNSKNGADWLAQQLAEAAQKTGYHIALQDFRLHGLSGVRAVYVTVADGDGVFATARNLDVSMDVFPLALRGVSVTIEAAALDILRLPAVKQQETKTETGISLPEKPELYFNRLTLDLRLPHLSLPPELVAGGLTLELESVQKLSFGDALQLRGGVVLKNPQGALAPYLPEQLVYKAAGDWGGHKLRLSSARLLKTGLYVFDLGGGYDMAQQVFDIAAKGALRQDISQTISKHMRGAIGQEVRVDFTASGTAAEAAGRLVLAGEMAGEKISATLPFALHGDLLELPSLSAALPGITVEGALVLNRATRLADGKITAGIAHFGLAETLSGAAGLQGSGSVSLLFTHPAGKQDIVGDVALQNIIYGTTSLSNARLRVTPQEDGRHHTAFTAEGFDRAPFKIEGAAVVDLENKAAMLEKTVLTLGKTRAVLSGGFSREALSLNAELENITPEALPFVTLDSYPVKITGGKISLDGTPAQPEITARANIAGRMRHISDAVLTAEGSYKDGAARFALTGKGRGIRRFDASAVLPVSFALDPFVLDISGTAPISGQVTGDFDLQQVIAPFLAAGQQLAGTVRMDAVLSGSPALPVYGGDLVLTQAAFHDAGTGAALQDAEGKMHFDQTGLVLESLTASDGGAGTLSVTGVIGMGAGRDRPDVTAAAVLRAMTLIRSDNVQATISGDVTIKPQSGQYPYLVAGSLKPDTVLITLPERFETAVPELNIVRDGEDNTSGILDYLALDLVVEAKNRVFVRGWGLDAELKGTLAVTGTPEEPDIRGTLGLVRGRYEELGRNFDILRADLRFQGAVPPSPYLDILTETRAGDIKPRIGITGTAEAPQITITSDPPRPQDEVIAQLLFGQDLGAISPFQAVQLAAAIRRLTTGERGGFDPVGEIRNAAGLDDLRVGGDADGGVTVGAGKYISDKVYIEAETGSGEAGGAAKIKIEVTPSVTVESKTGTTGTSGVGVFWKRDY